MKATFTRYSICICGFPILGDDVPIGTEFEVNLTDATPVTVKCGGCGKENHVIAVWVFSRRGERPGYLPQCIFQFADKPETTEEKEDHEHR